MTVVYLLFNFFSLFDNFQKIKLIIPKKKVIKLTRQYHRSSTFKPATLQNLHSVTNIYLNFSKYIWKQNLLLYLFVTGYFFNCNFPCKGMQLVLNMYQICKCHPGSSTNVLCTPEAYLEPSQTPVIKLFFENN